MNHQKTYILESKQRCKDLYHQDPSDIPFPKVSLVKKEIELRQEKYKELLSVSREFIKKLLTFMEGTPTLVLVSDDKGYILDLYGDKMIENVIQSFGIHVGTLFTEKDVGTNAISLALTLKEPIKLIGDDHYHYCLHSSACITAPFTYDNPEPICGTISIMTSVDYAGPFHLGLISSAVDSIERELKIRVQNRRLNLLHQVMVDSTQSGIIITDAEGIITEFNPAGEEITGLSKKHLVGTHVESVKPVSKYLSLVLSSGVKYENLEIVIDRNNERRTCLFDALPLYNERNHITGAFGKFKDITERIKLEKQMIAAEKLSVVGKLGAGFAHEIKNPLTSIIGFMTLLKDDIETEKSRKHFMIISNELDRIKNLVTQFVMMAKPAEQVKTKSNIKALISDIVTLMNNQASLQNVSINFSSNEVENWEVMIDDSQIKQVLINLIQNAIEAIIDEGTITISLSHVNVYDSSYIQIQIVDSGDGMTKEEQKSIFTPFHSSKEQGLGLGLSICKDIIESHKGILTVSSVKHEGTTFKILLPE